MKLSVVSLTMGRTVSMSYIYFVLFVYTFITLIAYNPFEINSARYCKETIESTLIRFEFEFKLKILTFTYS